MTGLIKAQNILGSPSQRLSKYWQNEYKIDGVMPENHF